MMPISDVALQFRIAGGLLLGALVILGILALLLTWDRVLPDWVCKAFAAFGVMDILIITVTAIWSVALLVDHAHYPAHLLALRPSQQEIMAHPDEWVDHVRDKIGQMPPALVEQILLRDVARWHAYVLEHELPKPLVARMAMANYEQAMHAPTQQKADYALARAHECYGRVFPTSFHASMSAEDTQRIQALSSLADKGATAQHVDPAPATTDPDRIAKLKALLDGKV